LRVLFSVRNPAYVRHYESVLRTLAHRGHTVDLAKQSPKHAWPPYVVALATENPRIRLSTLPDLAENPWWELATRYRLARFYLRFLAPAYRNTPALLDRARRRAPRIAVRMAERSFNGPAGRRLLAAAAALFEQATRSAAAFHRYLREQQPDVVVLTPLVVLKTTQLDLGRAATELGIRNVFAVASWDHLSSKGVLTYSPQQVFVWNETQRREAAGFHGVDPERVVVTGSQVFDDWFGRQPALSRDAFCRRVGLHADRPVILYVGSSLLEGSPSEAAFVERWVRHLRASSHPVLRDCGILVRPHPRRGREWRDASFEGLDNIVCWPPAGELPVDAASKTDYFDSLFHSAAVVGINSSAMIEAAIVGRPVHTVLVPEFQESQEGTVHFRYLLDGPDAVLRAARSLDDHARDLAESLDGRDVDPSRSGRFVRAFVRPRGIDTSATQVFVEAIEAVAQRPAPSPSPAPLWTHLLRPFLWPFARAAAARVRRLREDARRRKHEAILAHRRRKAAAAVDNMAVP
jgi:hypothetical protein